MSDVSYFLADINYAEDTKQLTEIALVSIDATSLQDSFTAFHRHIDTEERPLLGQWLKGVFSRKHVSHPCTIDAASVGLMNFLMDCDTQIEIICGDVITHSYVYSVLQRLPFKNRQFLPPHRFTVDESIPVVKEGVNLLDKLIKLRSVLFHSFSLTQRAS